MKNTADKLRLKDQGEYPNHKCGCGANARLGEDGDGIIWSWCPDCKIKLNIVSYPGTPAYFSHNRAA